MIWPPALVAELAARRCIIFLGAGASAGCKSADGTRNPPTWPALLNAMKSEMGDKSAHPSIDDLIAKERYLDAAEIIQNKINAADFARLVREHFTLPKFKPSSIHESVLAIDPKVVVTTNYDDIYDVYCREGIAKDGYNVCKYYEGHLVNDLRSPVRLVVKAHGCVSDASKIVLARSQYFAARQNHAAFYSVLDAMFLTSTLLFVGYGLADPDIQLVLENSNIAARCSHTHYALVEDTSHPDVESAVSRSYNINFLKFEKGRYDLAEQAMRELADAVTQFRISNPA